jgi:hypothetical protein
VCAHPGASKRGVLDDELLAEMAAAGMAGIEVDHPDHAEDVRVRLRGMATALGVHMTGSSDDHGALTGHRLGVCTTHPAMWAGIQEASETARSGVSSPRPSSS